MNKPLNDHVDSTNSKRDAIPSSTGVRTETFAAEFGPLEDRILYSATPIDVAALEGEVPPDEVVDADAATEHDTSEWTLEPTFDNGAAEATPSMLDAEPSLRELVLIDGRVSGLDQLLETWNDSAAVIVLDPEQDGVEQISDALTGQDDLLTVRLVASQEDGTLQLGATPLTPQTLAGVAGEITQWGDALHANGQVIVQTDASSTLDEQVELLDGLEALLGRDVVDGGQALEDPSDPLVELSLAADPDDSLATNTDVASTTDDWAAPDADVDIDNGVADPTAFDPTLEPPLAFVDDYSETPWDVDPSSLEPLPHEVAFIDGQLEHLDVFIADLQAAHDGSSILEIVILEANQDGIQQITDYFTSHQTEYSAVHLFTHGSAGEIQVGDVRLNAETLSDYETALGTWSTWLTGDADVLLYGCEVASQTGDDPFLVELSGVLGVDLAASRDATGYASLGGNWDLEYTSGTVVTNLTANLEAHGQWQGLLALTTQGSETLVNGSTASTQSTNQETGQNVAMDSSGRYVVTWYDNRSGNSDSYARVYNADGTARTAEFMVNATNSSAQDWTNVAMADNGNFVVTWSDNRSGAYEVYMRLFNVDGTALTGETLVTSLTGSQDYHAADFAADGSFVVAFQNASDTNVYFQRYNSSGVAQGGATIANNLTSGIQIARDIVVRDDGSFIVTWSDSTNDGNGIGIYARMFNSSGSALSDQFLVNTYTTGNQGYSSIDADSNGNFVVTWSSASQDGSGDGVYMKQYNSSGSALTGDVLVNTITSNEQRFSHVDMNAEGDFIVVWEDNSNDSGSSGIFSQQFDRNGTRIGGQVLVNATSTGNQTLPSVAFHGSSAVVAWQGNGPGDSNGIFFQRFTSTNYSTVTVTTSSNTADGDTSSIAALLNNRGADGQISLREAILATNNSANGVGGADRIYFNIGTGNQTISVSGSNLADITQALIIDGSTQSGFTSAPLISLVDGDTRTVGLTLASGSDGSTIRGLNLQGFGTSAITIVSSNNTIVGNYIGTNAAGTAAAGNFDGINIWSGDNNVIGGTGANDRNVISGQTNNGIVVTGGADNTQVINNYIGLNAAGTGAIANAVFGIYGQDSTGATIGGTTTQARNVISGNGNQGIYFNNVDNSYIYGNYIGTNAAGTGDINGTSSNAAQSGVVLANGSSGNQVGSTTTGARNIISGNNHYGVEILNATSTSNTIAGNYIGTTTTGLAALGNSGGGILFSGAGTGNLATSNVISGNTGNGVVVESASASVMIQGNTIGLGTDGSTVLGNSSAGVYVSGAATKTLIGSDANGLNDTSELNIISGNANGIVVTGTGTTGTMIYGNYIGTDATGTLDRGNTFDGVRIESGATTNYVGGTGTARRNVISGNDQDGVQIDGETTDGNYVQNNYIGSTATGTARLSNNGDGIFIWGGSDNNVIGGIGLGNTILASGLVGIEIDGASSGNTIQGNWIGTNSAGTVVVGQIENGILLENGANSNTIGGTTAGQGNVITGSGLGGTYTAGVAVVSTAGSNNTIVGNSIYGNGGLGIDLGAIGITSNDTLDADTGPNALTNTPTISSATTTGSTVNVSGSLNTLASQTGVTIHFYATTNSGNLTDREGQRYLGSTTVNTDASGNATFSNVALTATVTAGELITATTTLTSNGTSEFSQAVVATSSTGNSAPTGATVTTTGQGGLALNHDGGQNALLVADNGGAVFGGRTQFTIEARFAFTAATSNLTLLTYGVGSATFGNDVALRLPGDGSLTLFVNNASATANTFNYGTLADGQPHTISVAWNNTNGGWQVYVDGILRDSGTGLQTGATIASGGTLVVGQDQDTQGGSYDAAQNFEGTIYDLRVFNDVRTAAEVASFSDANVPNFESGLVANWTFNDLSENGVVTDRVSGNNLTLSSITDPSFASTSPTLTLTADENSINGTVVGTISGTDVDRQARITQLLAADSTLRYSAETGKFYKLVASSTDATTAGTNALATTLSGVAGQLATIRSAAENEVVWSFAQSLGGSVWLGASDSASEGTWRWYSGSTPADIYWIGSASGTRVDGSYTNWNATQPNDLNSAEDAVRLDSADGLWYDAALTGSNHFSVVEWNADDVLDATHPLTYSIQSQTIAGAFTINSDTGELQVADGTKLNYEANATHSVTVRVNDGTATYDKVFAITINDIDEVAQTIPLTQNLNEDSTRVFSTANGNAITVSFEPGTNDRLQLYLSVNSGTLTLSQTTGLTILGGANGSSFMTLHGTESDLNAALNGLTYTPTGNFNGTDTLTVTTSLAADLVGHYTFEGGTATDQSVGTSQNGSFVGNATTTSDPTRGTVLSLDGSGDYVQINSTFSNPTSVTIGGWVNFIGTGRQEFISINDRVHIALDDGVNGVKGSIQTGVGAWNDLVSTRSLSGTGWHHIMYTFDDAANVHNLYIDGSLVATESTTDSVYWTGATTTYIGTHPSSSWNLNGKVDDARIYTRALSATEVAELAADHSSTTGTVTLAVANVNDAPVLDNTGTMTLNAITENQTSSTGQTIASILSSAGGDRLTDIDSSASEGIAVTALASGAGTWQYSTDGGSTWQNVGVVSTSSALLLRATDSMRFLPDGMQGTSASFTFQGWDQSTGSAGARVDVTTSGGTTAFSTASETASITVSDVNDGPTFVAGDGIVTTNVSGSSTDFINASVVQPDGKVLVAGYTQNANKDVLVARYNSDGSLDTSFGGGDGIVTLAIGSSDDQIQSMTLLADGRILLAGTTYTGSDNDILLVQLTSTGAIDTTFGGGDGISTSTLGGNDEGYSVALQTDGKILVAAQGNQDFRVVRFTSGGAVDTTFGTAGVASADFSSGNDLAYSVAVQADGKIVVGGTAFNGTSFDYAVARFQTNGVLDTTFNGTGKASAGFGASSTDMGYTMALQTDGKIVVGGWSDSSGTNEFGLMRWTSTGSLDTTFSGDGKVLTSVGAGSDLGLSLAIQSDGKIITAGQSYGTSNNFGIVRYTATGALDTTFGGGDGILETDFGGSDDRAHTVALQADGRIVAAGTSTIQGSHDIALVRYLSNGQIDYSFDATNSLSGSVTHTEGGAAVRLGASASIFDAELSAANNFSGATLTIGRSGGANAQDQLAFDGINVTTSGANVLIGGIQVGTYSFTGGEMIITFNANATQARVNTVMQNVMYWNSSDTPPASVQINWAFNDGNSGVQGSGGALSASSNVTVNITATNDTPVLANIQGDSKNYAEGDAAVVLDSGLANSVSDVDSTNFDTGNLTISFLSNSDPAEDVLTVRNQGTGPGQIGLSVNAVLYGGTTIGTWTGGTGTNPLVITFNSNATPAAVSALLQNIAYSNTDTNNPTTGTRTLSWVVQDGDGGTSTTATSTVTVSGVNDEQTVAVNLGLSVAENSTSNVIGSARLQTTDVDNSASQLTYTITSAVANGSLRRNGILLSVNSTFTQADVDAGLITYDHNGSETSSDGFSFQVDDGAGTVSSGTFALTITPVNDQTPIIVSSGGGSTVFLNVSENSTAVTTVSATDGDLPSAPLSYSITGGADASLFAIDANSGVLTFVTGPNREAATDANLDNTYEVIVRASDGSLHDTQTIYVVISDVDESDVTAPTDANATANAVNENAANGTVVGITASASDADATTNTVTYSLTDNAGGRFAIDANTGVVTVANGTLLDREAAASHAITVRATSADGSTADTVFTINLNDIDESDVTAPTDANAAANAVNENAANGTVVGITASASDADATTNTVTYSLTDSAGGRFAIDANTGVVTVANGTLLNREAAASHAITVRATSADGSTADTVFTINLNDVDESDVTAPADSNAAANAVNENAANGTVVGITASASDADATTNTVTYSLTDSAGGRFAIDANTGVVTVANGTLLNREAAASHAITVRATSADGSTADTVFTINLNDIDESDVTAPTDVNATANAVNENAANGTVVGITASASDADATTNTVTYSLTDNAGGRFAIDANTGVVTVANGTLLNREAAASHAITVRATSADGSTADTVFTINLNDVDESDVTAPTDVNAAANAVNENAANGTVVGITASASDADATTNTVTYSLTDDAGGRFAIDANTGVVTVAGALDYETNTQHTITVLATSADGSTATQAFVIQVANINEGSLSAISDSNAAANAVTENAVLGTSVGVTALSTDPDSTDTVTYSLDDDASGRFTIDANTGVITVAGSLDREVAASYTIVVRATSSDTSSVTTNFVIQLNDVDESDVTAPADVNATANAVNENAANGTIVGITASASDADATTNTVTYSLTDDAGGRFAIDANTGVVTVANGTLLNREAAASHAITVRATSADGSTADTVFTINLNDVDESDVTAPTDVNATANAVNENAANGTVVGITASASDADATTNTVTYSLTDDAGGRFAIDANTGVVTVANGTLLNREAAASHAITVRATSADGSTADTVFTINLNDVDESDVTAPTDVNATANAVNENAANGTVVGITASASDADATTNTVTYSLTDSAGGRFAIDANTGVVTVANDTLLNREAAASHAITVRATSADGSTADTVFTINLNDVDESDVTAPADSNAAANAVNENAANGTVVGITASASDADATTNTVTYSLTDSAGGRFAIDANTGVVTVANGTLLDREAAASHAITVRATSADGSTADTVFTINLNDVDESDVTAPTDANAAANAVIENAANGTVVGITASASDADATTNTVTYSLTDSAGGRFAIDANTGVVTVANGTLLDREAAASHAITVRATSADGSTADTVFTINLNDVDESDVTAPTDVNATANAVNENAANGTVVGITASASDADATTNTVTYSLTDSAGGRFAIDANTGVVTVANGTLLNREAAASHAITVRATSADGSTADTVFTINLNDVDESDVTAPADSNAAANAVNENAANGTVVGITASASDADATTNTVTYSLTDSAGGRFAIDANTGVVTVANGTLLDREAAASHAITVRATSADGSTADTVFTINLNDVDESDVTAPADANATANAVNENAANGTVVGITASASDADATTNTVTYSLTDNAGGRFAIDANTGVVTVANGTLLDREGAASHAITIRATSADGSTADTVFTINLNDVDESDVTTPTDSNAAANAVNENAANGTVVGITASASDADATTNTVTYSLTDNAGGRFAIDANTGVVTVANGTLLNREAAASHAITVRATSADGSTADTVFTINLNDVDESDVTAPADVNATANAVNENAANGTVVGITASASDADATTNTVTYSLTDDAGGRFAIDANTGVVTVANGTLLNREAAASHAITVRATSADGSTADTVFTINLNDIDESDVTAPTDVNATANAVNENAANGTVVGITASASDADATTNTVTYSLTDNAGGRFAIDANTGVVTVANGTLLDREAAASHAITIRATSADGSTADTVFTINLNDIDESDVTAPTDVNATANAVNENAANGTVVGITASASDADATTNTVTYSLTDNAGGRFAIDANTGVVTVAGALDYETNTQHTITVLATSADGSTATQAFVIQVANINEGSLSAISDSNAAANAVTENAVLGTSVGVTALSTDPDSTDTVTYSLDDDASGRFTIDANTGVITVAGSLDREVAASYTIVVRATSSDTSSVTTNFVIQLNDVDESDVTAPADSNAAANAVNENAANGTVVGITASASDADATTNTVTYSLTDSAGGRFAIDANTGVVTVANGTLLNREAAASHAITVRATSADGSTADTVFTINLNDIDESDVTAPTDVNATANAVNENAANGTVVGITASASDADATTNTVTYSLTDSAGGRFAIDANTGVVTVANGTLLDREAAASHAITVRATSADGSTADTVVTINLNDVDESDVTAPTDANATANAVNENAANGTVVGITASASDADATTNTVTYSLTDDAGGRFAIDANTGVVTVANGTLLDREAAASHAITVRATSADGSTADTVFTINLNDVDESDVTAPTDANATANAVNENAANGTVVGITASASDADATTNTVTYSLTDSAGGRFAIDANTGVVTVANGTLLDREAAASHAITVRATSADGSTADTVFTINLNDVDESDVTAPTDANATANAVNENAVNGTVVGITASASDADATMNTVTYSLTDDAGGRFAIDANTGVVTVANGTLLNREAAASHAITVRATSADGSTADTVFTINLNDVDESDVTAPADVNATANAVNENTANGTVVGITASASDADATTNTVTYSLTDSAGGRFAIDANTGVVTVANGTLLDREGAASHAITIRATSADGSTADTVFTINLNDVDENDVTAPADSNAAANAVNENAANGTVVGITASASDADATTNTVTYSLTDSAGGRFAIDANTGVVTVANGTLLDREAAASHAITVRATSADGSTADTVFTINLNDVDESDVTAPTDVNATANAVNENAANGTVVGITASASDADATTNTVTYSLTDNAGGRFAIDANTGVVTVANGTLLDREAAASHAITVRATSADGSTADTVMVIDLTDQNDNAPTILASGPLAVSENVPAGTLIGTLQVADVDTTGTSPNWSIVGGTGASLFDIASPSGEIRLRAGAMLDFETTPSVTLDVVVSDGQNVSSTQTITILIQDQAETPVAQDDSFTIAEDQTMSVGNGVSLLDNDYDPDQQPMSVQLVANTRFGSLTLLPDGTFTYLPQSNFVGVDSFQYQVVDQHGVSNTATVTLNVTPVNDGPVWTLPSSQMTMRDTPLTLSSTGGNLIQLDDVDAGSQNLRITLAASQGMISLSTAQNITVISGNAAGDTTLTLVGPLNDLNLAIQNMRFTPTLGYTGPASVSFLAEDLGNTGAGGALSSQGLVNIVVGEPPKAIDDAFLMTGAGPYAPSDGLIANDQSPMNIPTSVVLITAPQHGTVILTASGTFSFIPDATFTGTDSFQYQLVAGPLTSNVATVQLTIISAIASPSPTDTLPSTTDGGSSLGLPDSSPSTGLSSPLGDLLDGSDSEPDSSTINDSSTTTTDDSENEASRDSSSDSPTAENPAGPSTSTEAESAQDGVTSLPIGSDSSPSHSLDRPLQAALTDLLVQEAGLVFSGNAPPGTTSRVQTGSIDQEIVDESEETINALALRGFELPALAFDEIELWRDFDSLREELGDQVEKVGLIVGTATSLFAGASLSYAVWALRGAYLASGIAWAMPGWRFVDPLPILDDEQTAHANQKRSLEPRESLIDIIRRGHAARLREATKSGHPR